MQKYQFSYVIMKYSYSTLIECTVCYLISDVCVTFYSTDDDDRDIQGDRAVDYGKRHQAIDIL